MNKLLFAGFASILLAGCGSKGTTVVTSDGGTGNMSVTDKEGNKVDYKVDKDGSWSSKSSKGEEIQGSKDGVTMKNEKGEVSTMGVSEVTEAELGLPFYTGSTPTTGRDMKLNADGKQTFLSARSTSDAPSKVVEFYKDKVKGPQTTTSDKFASVNGKLEDGRTVTLMAIAQDKGGTEVQISVSGPSK